MIFKLKKQFLNNNFSFTFESFILSEYGTLKLINFDDYKMILV